MTRCIDNLLHKFYTQLYSVMTSVIQQIYCVLYCDCLHILGMLL